MKNFELTAFLQHRYGPSNPFTLAEKLNVQINWADFESSLLGRTKYFFGDPVIFLNSSIKDSPKRYYVLAHEIGHVVLHEGLEGFYNLNDLHRSQSEYDADTFAVYLLYRMYLEDHIDETLCYSDLQQEYGLPERYIYLFQN